MQLPGLAFLKSEYTLFSLFPPSQRLECGHNDSFTQADIGNTFGTSKIIEEKESQFLDDALPLPSSRPLCEREMGIYLD